MGVRIQLVDGRAAPILARPYYAADGETSPIVRALAQVPELLPATMPFLAAGARADRRSTCERRSW